MKYDARACSFNMDTGCVELLLLDGRKISIDCTGVEDALDVTMVQSMEIILPSRSSSSTQPVSMLKWQALASYFMFVSFLPYGTLTVVCRAFL